MSGLGAKDAGQQEQAADNFNATINDKNTAENLIANEQRYSSLVGKQATAYAAAGVDITRGSPLLMMAATAGRGGRQAAEIKQAGDERSTLERYYGKVAAWRGTMSGIGTALNGISSAAQQYLKSTGYQGGGDSGGGGGGDFGDSGGYFENI